VSKRPISQVVQENGRDSEPEMTPAQLVPYRAEASKKPALCWRKHRFTSVKWPLNSCAALSEVCINGSCNSKVNSGSFMRPMEDYRGVLFFFLEERVLEMEPTSVLSLYSQPLSQGLVSREYWTLT
jgi:hypothetical protein